MIELESMIREYNILYNSFFSLYEIWKKDPESSNEKVPEQELLQEIEKMTWKLSTKKKKMKELEEENKFFRDEMERFKAMQVESMQMRAFIDKEEGQQLEKMQEEISMLSKVKVDNKKTLKNLEQEREDLKFVLEKLANEKQKDKSNVEKRLNKMSEENERLKMLEEGLKEKISQIQTELSANKSSLQKMVKEKKHYLKKYKLMTTLYEGHEFKAKSLNRDLEKLRNEKRDSKEEAKQAKQLVNQLVKELETLGVNRGELKEKLGNGIGKGDFEEEDSFDNSLNETLNEDLKEIEGDFADRESLLNMNTEERANLDLDQTFNTEVQLEDVLMQQHANLGSGYEVSSDLDLSEDLIQNYQGEGPGPSMFHKANRFGEDQTKTSIMGVSPKFYDKEEHEDEELQRIYDKISDSNSDLKQSKRGLRLNRNMMKSTKSEKKEDIIKTVENQIEEKIRRKQDEAISRRYTSNCKSGIFGVNRQSRLLSSSVSNNLPDHKSVFDFGVDSRKLEMDLLKKTKDTINGLCSTMNDNVFEGNEQRKLAKGIKKIKKVEDLVQWVFMYFSKKLGDMEGTIMALKSDNGKWLVLISNLIVSNDGLSS